MSCYVWTAVKTATPVVRFAIQTQEPLDSRGMSSGDLLKARH